MNHNNVVSRKDTRMHRLIFTAITVVVALVVVLALFAGKDSTAGKISERAKMTREVTAAL